MQQDDTSAPTNGQATPEGPDLEDLEALKYIFDYIPASDWPTFPEIKLIAKFRNIPRIWLQIKTCFKEKGGWPPELEQAVDQTFPRLVSALDLRETILLNMDEVTAQSIDWLWWPYLAYGKLHMLDGDPGVGKSLFTAHLAAILSRGWPLPEQQ